ncbi:MAG: hypothetical protein ACSLFM_13190 [Tepidiformaceae bacterium]|jgi:hypothetical protein
MIDADEIVRLIERELIAGADSEVVYAWADGAVTREGRGHRDDWTLDPDSRPIASFVVNGDVVARAPILEQVLRGFDERGIALEEGS